MIQYPTRQIKTYGTNYSQEAYYAVNNKSTYECANSSVTRGITLSPLSLNDCLDRFTGIKDIAQKIGFLHGIAGAPSTLDLSGPYGVTAYFQKVEGNGYNYYLWTGATGGTADGGIDPYFPVSSMECSEVESTLGYDWLGCLWGTPTSNLSCRCPEIGENYDSYLKLRLNNATFWNTPKETPVKRSEFLDAFKYGKKVDVTIAGDFKLKVGQVIYLNANYSSGYVNDPNNVSDISGNYYITGLKHVVSNSGTHETSLSLSQIAGHTDYP
jgi:hypothetical protein